MLIPDMLLKQSRSDKAAEGQTAVHKVKPRTKRPENREGRGETVTAERLVHEELRFFRRSMKGGLTEATRARQSVSESKLEVVEMNWIIAFSLFSLGEGWMIGGCGRRRGKCRGKGGACE